MVYTQQEVDVTAAAVEAAPPPPPATATRRDWLALAALAFAQFVVVVDATIVNVALPSIGRQFALGADQLTWVVNGYVLTASGLLLVGGRIGDILGRRRMFLAGTVLFTLASLGCGLAPNATVLIAGRFVQGAGEALMSPAALALVALVFREDRLRAKAFGILGAVAGVAAVSGVVLSGLLTGLASWRWIFLINVPLAAIPLILVPRLVGESRSPDADRRIPVPTVLTLTASLIAIVFGLLHGGHSGWLAAVTVGPIAAGIAGVAAVLYAQTCQAQPIIPLSFFANRVRASGVASIAFLSSASAAVFFLYVLYEQDVLGYSPLASGLAWLPFCAAFMVGLMASTRLINRYGARRALVLGLLCGGAGVLLLSRAPVDAVYVIDIAPAMALTAFGFGVTNPALQHAAMHAVSERDAGLGAGVSSTVFQMGGAVGLAVLVSVALRHESSLATTGVTDTVASANGIQLALRIAGAVLIAGAAVTAILMPPKPAE